MKTRFIPLFVLSLLVTIALSATPPEEGKSIFLSRCAACHNINKVLTGPALSGVHERRSLDWIVSFIHSSQSLVRKGDSTAVALFEKFNKVPMPDHLDLTEENIKSIVDYIRSESKPITEEKAPFAKPTEKKPFYLPLSLDNYGFLIGYLFVVIGLIASLYFSVQLKKFQRNNRENSSV